MPRVVLLAGGVGGARMARGLAQVLAPGHLSVVVNVGDDDWFHGLRVCTDLDTVLYTLAGVVDPAQGWGVAGDQTLAQEVLRRFTPAQTWMKLGDADIGLHIHRTHQLRLGHTLTQVMADAAQAYAVASVLLPVTDSECPTRVETSQGAMRFQEWFVKERAAPRVTGLDLRAADGAQITPQVRAAIEQADLIVFAPSNPLLSIAPLLAVGGLRELIERARAPRIAVSPLIGGKSVKGPLVKLMQDMGMQANLATIIKRYQGLIDAFVVDTQDEDQAAGLSVQFGLEVLCAPLLIAHSEPAGALGLRLLAWRACRAAGAAGEERVRSAP